MCVCVCSQCNCVFLTLVASSVGWGQEHSLSDCSVRRPQRQKTTKKEKTSHLLWSLSPPENHSTLTPANKNTSPSENHLTLTAANQNTVPSIYTFHDHMTSDRNRPSPDLVQSWCGLLPGSLPVPVFSVCITLPSSLESSSWKGWNKS